MRKKDYIKAFAFILIYTLIFIQVAPKSVFSSPVAVAEVFLTPEGLQAAYSIASLLGLELQESVSTGISVISEDEYNSLSDDEKAQYISCGSGYCSKRDLINYNPFQDSLTSEQIDFFNSVGSSRNEDGSFNVFADGWDYITDFYKNLIVGSDVSTSYVSDVDSVFEGGLVTSENAISYLSLKSNRYGNDYDVLANFSGDSLILCVPYLMNGNSVGFVFVSDSAFNANLSIYRDGVFNANNFMKSYYNYYPDYLPNLHTAFVDSFYLNGGFTVKKNSGTLLNVSNNGNVLAAAVAGLIDVGDYGLNECNTAEIDGISYNLVPGSFVDSLAAGTSSSSNCWDYITDMVVANGVAVSDEDGKPVVITSDGEAIPLTGVAIPAAGAVEVDEEGNAVFVPTDFSNTSVRALTNTNVAESDSTADDDILDPDITADTTTDLGILQGLWSWVTSFFTNLYKTLLKALKWLATALIGSGSIDLSKFKISVDSLPTVFPFCIPFDMYNILTILNHTAEAPVFTFDFNNTFLGNYCDFKISFDLSQYAELIALFRSFVFLIFSVGLMRITRDLIRG